MHSKDDTTRDITPIRIRTRRVFSGSGESTDARTVHCPARGSSVSASACQLCGHDRGFHVSPAEEVLFCDHEEAREAMPEQPQPIRNQLRDRTPVRELMTAQVLCVRPDVSLEALQSLLLERGISSAPVVNDRGEPLGMVSKTDLVQHRHDAGETEMVERRVEAGFHTSALVEATVADIMTPLSITLPEDALIAQAAAVMAYERMHTLPVVGVDGTVIGIVSSLDIARWYAAREGYMLGTAPRGWR